MLDVMMTCLPELRQLPFQDIRASFVVVSAEEWAKRVREREAFTPPEEIRKRICEGIASLTWGLDQDGDSLSWLNNSEPPVENTARDFIERVRDPTRRRDTNARKIGASLLAEMQKMQ
jgi:hypothetical protein